MMAAGKKIAIIGAGASGLMAAIAAAGGRAQVCVYERNEIAGRKLLATGNGKCNLSNINIKAISQGNREAEDFYNGSCCSLVKKAYEGFGYEKTWSFFEAIGVHLKLKDELVYPYSEQASQVAQLLYEEAERRGAVFYFGIKVTGIEKKEAGYELTLGKLSDGSMEKEYFDVCILACGSRAMPVSGSDGFGYKLCKKLGIPLVKPAPVLNKCLHEDLALRQAAGSRCRAELSLFSEDRLIAKSRGELQLTREAMSGIVTFQLSSKAAGLLEEKREAVIAINFCPDMTKEERYGLIEKRQERAERLGLPREYILKGLINDRLIPVILNGGRDIAGSLGAYRVKITALAGYDSAQVCSGGIAGRACEENFGIRSYPGLFAAGELWDADGLCGGFNLQFAFSSGFLAGEAALKYLEEI